MSKRDESELKLNIDDHNLFSRNFQHSDFYKLHSLTNKAVKLVSNSIKSHRKEDIVAGIRMLRMFGKRDATGSPIQFIKIINNLQKDGRIFSIGSSGKLKISSKLISDLDLVDRNSPETREIKNKLINILDNYQFHLEKSSIQDYLRQEKNPILLSERNHDGFAHRMSLAIQTLLSGNGPHKELLNHINQFKLGKRRDIDNVGEITFSKEAIQYLHNRKDRKKIVSALKDSQILLSKETKAGIFNLAVQVQDWEFCEFLLSNMSWDFEFMRSKAINAIRKGNNSLFKTILESKAQAGRLDIESFVGYISKESGFSLIHEAALSNNLEAILLLEEYGADLNQKAVGRESHFYNGASALHITAAKDFTDATKLLIRLHANLEQRNHAANRPLDYAARYGSYSTFRTLINRGANT